MKTTIDWLGTATFRLQVGETTLFLDAYMDRIAGATPVGLSAKDVTQADFVLVGHAHFDHIAGAEVIAGNTGAKIIGSHESCRVMREKGVPEEQLLPSSGGERHRLAPGITATVFPSLHACTWILTDPASDERETGHTGLTQDERAECPGLVQHITTIAQSGSEEGRAVMQHVLGATGSRSDGGPLVYLIETPDMRIFVQDTSGCWTGVLAEIDADVAILAASGRPNVNGEPIQGSMADFVGMEASLVGAKKVILGHHDDWMPPVTRKSFDMGPVRAELARRAAGAELIDVGYMSGTVL